MRISCFLSRPGSALLWIQPRQCLPRDERPRRLDRWWNRYRFPLHRQRLRVWGHCLSLRHNSLSRRWRRRYNWRRLRRSTRLRLACDLLDILRRNTRRGDNHDSTPSLLSLRLVKRELRMPQMEPGMCRKEGVVESVEGRRTEDQDGCSKDSAERLAHSAHSKGGGEGRADGQRASSA